MKANKILVPIDFSPSSDEAVEAACMLARGGGGELLIVYIEEPPNINDGTGFLYEVPTVDSGDALKRLQQIAPSGNLRAQYRVLKGLPTEAILETAETEQVDVIVMGTHGRRGITALLMGSVAEAVVRRAKCPVFVVKDVPKPT